MQQLAPDVPRGLSSAAIGRAATWALYTEVAAYPKPGLVSFRDCGSHRDMTGQTFLRSLSALRGYFPRAAALGANATPFDPLRRLGLDAEASMLAATAGVNTHRGAIFSLGLLAGAAGRKVGHGAVHQRLGEIVADVCGDDIRRAARAAPPLPGAKACRRYNVGGARAHAADGFPLVYRVALPAVRRVRASGRDLNAACVQALFAVVAALDDTSLLHRGGRRGLEWAQRQAHDFLAAGGVTAAGWQAEAERVHRSFIERRLSPGGSADLLACTLFLDRLGEQ